MVHDIPDSMASHDILEYWVQSLERKTLEEILLPLDNSEREKNTILKGIKVDFSSRDIHKIVDDYEVQYTDGTRYFGNRDANNIPEGRGQVEFENERTLSGSFKAGTLNGEVSEIDPSDMTVTDVTYEGGLPHGTFRTKRSDGQLVAYGKYNKGRKVGPALKVGSGGNSFFLGNVDENNQLVGEVVYFYPGFRKAIVGTYLKGKLVEGQYTDLEYASMDCSWPKFVFGSPRKGLVKYDPSTFLRISRTPLEEDDYEAESVMVGQSSVGGAGEGLFARRKLGAGELVSLFSGNKIPKGNSRKGVGWGDEEWSDFRLMLDKEVDLDVPPEYRSLTEYCATLGHKACHSFSHKNAVFKEFEHPRFGCIMSVVATKNILPGEEVFVDYNYSIPMAPPWYQALWRLHHLASVPEGLGWSKEQLRDWVINKGWSWDTISRAQVM